MKVAFRNAANRFQEWPYYYYYAKCKLAIDPAYPAVVEILSSSPRPLLDLGCGMGLLAACLRESGHEAPIMGVDTDAEKIGIAQKVLAGEQAEFHGRDAREFPEHSGDIVLLDALHYFSDEDQQALLRKIAAHVAPGGRAVIRMALSEDNWRYTATRIEEWIVGATRWIPDMGRNFPERDEVIAPFREAGFEVECRPMWGITPFNSYLFVFSRPEA